MHNTIYFKVVNVAELHEPTSKRVAYASFTRRLAVPSASLPPNKNTMLSNRCSTRSQNFSPKQNTLSMADELTISVVVLLYAICTGWNVGLADFRNIRNQGCA